MDPESRASVTAAKAFMMPDLNITEAAAFRWIRTQAMQQRRTMKDIADDVIVLYERKASA